MRKTRSPSEAEFIQVYQKLKYGINLLAKLGHHLSNPSADEMLEGFFVYMREFIKKNKSYVAPHDCVSCGYCLSLLSPHTAASVQVPLLTKAAIDLMLRVLSPRDSALWGELGANWRIPE